MLNFFPFCIVALVLYVISAIIIGKMQGISVRRQLVSLIFFAYSLIVIDITIFPIPLHSFGNLPHNNLIPFNTIRGIIAAKSIPYDFYNLGGNVALFIPFGFFLPALLKNKSRATRVIGLGFCAAFLVESCKYIISSILGFTYRDFDVDDLILNTFGSLVGYASLQLLLYVRKSVKLKSRTFKFIAIPIVSLCAVGGLWGYEYLSHSTPQRAQQAYDSNVLPLVTVPFSKGVVFITQIDPTTSKQAGYMAWYFERNSVLGWRLKMTSKDLLKGSINSMIANGQTFVWGTSGNSHAKTVIYHRGKEIYKIPVRKNGFWDITLPFSQSTFVDSDWVAVLPNGHSAPLYK